MKNKSKKQLQSICNLMLEICDLKFYILIFSIKKVESWQE